MFNIIDTIDKAKYISIEDIENDKTLVISNDERKEDEPIILAGGPCTYNPLPMAEFIDVFCIGYGGFWCFVWKYQNRLESYIGDYLWNHLVSFRNASAYRNSFKSFAEQSCGLSKKMVPGGGA